MARVLGVDLVPLHVPIHRRLQTFSVIFFTSLFLLAPLVIIYGAFLLLYTRFWWLIPTYAIWLFYDLDQSKRGSRSSAWVRNWAILHWLRDYFPVSLRKTAPLPPDRNYIFGYHPHGVLAFGAFVNFATDTSGFKDLFPGITAHLVTLVGQFRFPFRRELIMATGSIESSKESIDWVISHPDKGKVAVIVVGGASEVLHARPGDYQVIMSRRKGFIRMAMHRGSNGIEWKWVESLIKKVTGFPIPIIYGRGIFNYTFGWMPYRLPITTIGFE